MHTKPFTIAYDAKAVARIHEKIAATVWPRAPKVDPKASWSYGADKAYVQELCAYWQKDYDWQKHQHRLNRFSHYQTMVKDSETNTELLIHYVYEKGSGSNPKTLLLTHGWPGSFYEFMEVVEPLAHPERFGGNPQDGVTVVVPSLPGYAFSQAPSTPQGPRAVARLWNSLMQNNLGVSSYIAQGGDWGSLISAYLGLFHSHAHGGGCAAVHINMYGLQCHGAVPETKEEKAWAHNREAFMFMETSYLRQQMTRPQSLAFAMEDSPVGACAWIVEKFYAWGDIVNAAGEKNIEHAFSKDQLLTNIMLYVLPQTFTTATWIYRGLLEEGSGTMAPGERVEVPVGIANFKGEAFNFPPRRMIELGYNVVRWTDYARGGHFAALETGDVFVKEVQDFCRSLD